MKKLLSCLFLTATAFAQVTSIPSSGGGGGAPTGAAGPTVLSGTYPDPGITAGAITNTMLGSGISASKITTGTLSATQLPNGGVHTGDSTTTFPAVTVTKVNSTTVPVNSAADQVLLTTASATGSWATITGCLDTLGKHLNYNTTTHAFSCGTSVAAFPNSVQRGTFMGSTFNNSTAAALNTFASGNAAAPTAACGGSGATAVGSTWMHPTAGYLRNVTLLTTGANTLNTLHANMTPGCEIYTYIAKNGGVYVPPGAAASGYISQSTTNQNDYLHINQYSPLAFSFVRLGGGVPGIAGMMGVEFISDDGTADTVFAYSQDSVLTASSTQYISAGGGLLLTTDVASAMPVPIAGTLKNLMFSNTTSPTAAVTVTVAKNNVATAITKTIGAADAVVGQYADVTNTAALVAGDYFNVQTASGATTQATIKELTLLFVPTDGTSAILYGFINGTVTTTNKYSQPLSNIVSTTETNVEYVSPVACTLSNLYVYQSAVNGAGVTTTFTMRKNEAATALTGTIGVGVSGSQAVDTTNSVAIVAGDRLSLQYITNTGTSGSMAGWAAKCN